MLIAQELNVGFILVRKPNKLPYETISATYDLEYGIDTLEIHTDTIQKGDRILIPDDVLATGRTIGCRNYVLIQRTRGYVIPKTNYCHLPFLGFRQIQSLFGKTR